MIYLVIFLYIFFYIKMLKCFISHAITSWSLFNSLWCFMDKYIYNVYYLCDSFLIRIPLCVVSSFGWQLLFFFLLWKYKIKNKNIISNSKARIIIKQKKKRDGKKERSYKKNSCIFPLFVWSSKFLYNNFTCLSLIHIHLLCRKVVKISYIKQLNI